MTEPTKPTAQQDDSATNARPTRICANCETLLSGPFCHECGQSSSSIIRFFGSLVSELFDNVMSLDSRALRSLSALMIKPGFLTNEYIKGRRVHYVSPFRLFLFSSILCFFVLWLVNLVSSDQAVSVIDETQNAKLQLPAEMRTTLFKDNPELQLKLKKEEFDQLSEQEWQVVAAKIRQANEKLNSIGMPAIKFDQRLVTSENADNTKAAVNSPSDSVSSEKEAALPGKPQKEEKGNKYYTPKETYYTPKKDHYVPKKKDGDSKVNIKISGLSGDSEEYLQSKLRSWVDKIKSDPKEFVGDLLELIPKTMLFLLPIFALCMRLSYPFARRFYIEHLIHAIHGHAFLFLSIMLAVIFELIADGIPDSSGFFLGAIDAIARMFEVLVLVWIPVYFWMSLRNVYHQSWSLTTFKWFTLGVVYSVLFGIGTLVVIIINALIS